MKKAELKAIAEKYGVNHRALKYSLMADGIDRKTATQKDVLWCIYINAPTLLWSRSTGYDGEVEYLDYSVVRMLIEDMSATNSGVSL